MSERRRNWLVMAGPLSGYTFDLFESIASLGGIDVRFLHTPLDRVPSFQHEDIEDRTWRQLHWKDASWSEIRRFVREPVPDAAFVYGTQPRAKLGAALALLPSATPLWYAADTNIAALGVHPVRALARRLAYMPVVRRATAALSLGSTNHMAMKAVGFRHIVALPVYATDFAALDASAGISAAARSRDEIVLLVLARLVPVKNLPGFVSALARQTELLPRLRVVVAGEGPDRAALEEIRRRTPLLKLELLGAVPRPQVGDLLARADALVLPSLVEPWGIAVVEALGMGLPVVATPAVGAAVSLAASSRAVLLSNDCQPESVVASVRQLVVELPKLTAAAREGKSAIRGRFDRIAVARETIRLVYGKA